MDQETITLEYPEYGCSHDFPDDWEVNEWGDVRTDPRWLPTTYEFLDEKLNRIAITQVPICDHAALTLERAIVETRANRKAVIIIATRHDGKPEMILNEMEV